MYFETIWMGTRETIEDEKVAYISGYTLSLSAMVVKSSLQNPDPVTFGLT